MVESNTNHSLMAFRIIMHGDIPIIPEEELVFVEYGELARAPFTINQTYLK